MSPRVNLPIQIAALLVFAAFRIAAPGWWLMILVFSLVGVIAIVLPSILAVVTLRRPRLTWPVAVPFLTGAVCLVVAGGLFPDFDDQRSYVPLLTVLGVDGDADGLLAGIGGVAVLGFLVSVVVTAVAMGVTAARRPATTPRRSPPETSPPASNAAAST